MEWKEVRLGDVCDLVAGYAFKAKDFGDFPHKVIKIGDINPPFVNYESELGVNLENYDTRKLEKYLVRYDDFVLAMTGATIGKVGRYVAQEPSYLNQRVLLFKAKENVCSKLLYYIVTSPIFAKYVVNHIDSESAQPNISAGTISKYELQIPSSIDDQRRISSILSSLDRKIELNNKVNATLEEMAQALFKSWFVDFEPFKNGNFIDTEIGKIPEGWRVGTLGEIVDFKNGFAFKSSSFSPNGQYKLVTIKAVQDGKLVTDGADKIESLPAKMPAHCLLKNGDILLSLTGNVGRVCIVTEDDLLLNQRVAAIEPKDSISKLYTYLLFRRKKTQNELIGISRGTAQANLSPIEAAKLQHVIPSVDALQRFNQALGTAFEKFIKLSQETLTLTHLRDTLLPRLMAGEIEV